MSMYQTLFRGAVACCTLGSLVSTPKQATAQGVFDMGVLTNTVSQGAVEQSERKRGAALKGVLTRSVTTKNRGKATRLFFTPSVAVRKRNVADFVSRMRQIDPQNAESLEKDLATKDIFGALDKKLAGYEMKASSLTDALTVYVIVAWEGVHGSNDDPQKTHVLAVRGQMARALGGVPALASAPDAKKQELADAFLLQALLIDSYIAGAKKTPEQMPKVVSAIATGTRSSLGFDLTTLKLTGSGLHP